MNNEYILSWAQRQDYIAIADVMYDAVRNGPSRYTDAQRRQWMPERRSGDDWDERLDKQEIVIARKNADVVGFMSLDTGGYIDFAYIRPSSQGSGLFRLLFTQIEALSAARGDDRLWVHASLMAQPVFAAMGFNIVERQTVRIGDQEFQRAEMEKAGISVPEKAL